MTATPASLRYACLLGQPLPTPADLRARALVAERRACYSQRLGVVQDAGRPARQRLTYLGMTQDALGWLNEALQAAGLPTEPAPKLPTVSELLAAA